MTSIINQSFADRAVLCAVCTKEIELSFSNKAMLAYSDVKLKSDLFLQKELRQLRRDELLTWIPYDVENNTLFQSHAINALRNFGIEQDKKYLSSIQNQPDIMKDIHSRISKTWVEYRTMILDEAISFKNTDKNDDD